ncbi:unnamed protein product [Paramecium sonneborni]|uniref:Uncharacterized protein n=1 Tax=Paramecium sonneborni TaxID=65129 RepID=A0A8S1R6Y2_9CILI|nr:unnamed protein product [Paramecium sonneborni]
MSFIELIGIDNQEIEFEENKNSVKEIKLQSLLNQSKELLLKSKQQILMQTISIIEKSLFNQSQQCQEKRQMKKFIEVHDYEGIYETLNLKPPNKCGVIKLHNKQIIEQQQSKILSDRQIDQIVEFKLIFQTYKFGNPQKFLSSHYQFDNIIEKQKIKFQTMYQQKSQINKSKLLTQPQKNKNMNNMQYQLMNKKKSYLFKLSELKINYDQNACQNMNNILFIFKYFYCEVIFVVVILKMLSDIKQFEQEHKEEMKLLQQKYEQKIELLSQKIDILQKELEVKDNIYSDLKNRSILNDESKIQKTDEDVQDFGATIQKFHKQKEREMMKIKKNYQKELIHNQKLLRKKDATIEQLQQEISQYKQAASQNMDNQKILLLSKLIDLANEIHKQL